MIITGHRRIVAPLAATLLALSVTACQRAEKAPGSQEPQLEAAPLEQGAGPWKVATSDTISLTVTAPGADKVRFIYRPVVAAGRHVVLKTLAAPTAPTGGKFSTEVRATPDFAGHVWAEITYPDQTTKQTEAIPLTTATAISPQSGNIPLDSIGRSAGTDESERSDKLTGGRIERAPLSEGDPRVWITVNVPAFRLTLWQAGKEVKTYQIGVGRKNFPIVIGERKATQIIWNPEWVPPDSSWVEAREDVEPGERIEPDDPRNPLGKIKIPLGQGYLIHQAAKPSDLGRLVSHGCVRMLPDDLFDLTEKIVAARRLPITKEQIEHAKASADRLAVKLDPPLWVDINYDTQVVEGGVLHLYPDVYGRHTNTVDNLRAELQASGVNASGLDENTLKQMLGRVTREEEFVVSISDIKAGRALTAGQQSPLTDYSVQKKPGGNGPRRSP